MCHEWTRRRPILVTTACAKQRRQEWLSTCETAFLPRRTLGMLVFSPKKSSCRTCIGTNPSIAVTILERASQWLGSCWSLPVNCFHALVWRVYWLPHAYLYVSCKCIAC